MNGKVVRHLLPRYGTRNITRRVPIRFICKAIKIRQDNADGFADFCITAVNREFGAIYIRPIKQSSLEKHFPCRDLHFNVNKAAVVEFSTNI